LPQSWKKSIGVQRVKIFEKYILEGVARTVNCPTWIFVGEAEARAFPQLQKQAKDTHIMLRDRYIDRSPKR
jgi:hypothetical protein